MKMFSETLIVLFCILLYVMDLPYVGVTNANMIRNELGIDILPDILKRDLTNQLSYLTHSLLEIREKLHKNKTLFLLITNTT